MYNLSKLILLTARISYLFFSRRRCIKDEDASESFGNHFDCLFVWVYGILTFAI